MQLFIHVILYCILIQADSNMDSYFQWVENYGYVNQREVVAVACSKDTNQVDDGVAAGPA